MVLTASDRPHAQRRPEITPGYDPEPVPGGRETARALNEGRRLPPATTSSPAAPAAGPWRTLNEGRRLPPATTAASGRHRAVRVAALNEGRRLPPATTVGAAAGPLADHRRSTKAGDYPRLRHHGDGCGLRVRGRSTKAGDYPRLRPSATCRYARRFLGAQRRPEITPGYDRRIVRGEHNGVRALNEGRRLPPATTRRSGGEHHRESAPLNEGRRLPPATTGRSAAPPSPVTAALNEGRRLPPATTRELERRKHRRDSHAQRRPEITPGYDVRLPPHGEPGRAALNEGRRLPPATTGTCSGRGRALRRSTKAGDYPRLRPGRPSRWASTPRVAQRRPEITPGYDEMARFMPGFAGQSLNEGRRLPPATTGTSLAPPFAGPCTLNEGRRLPPATTAAVSRSFDLLFPLNEGRRLPPATTRFEGRGRPDGAALNEGRRLPPATTLRAQNVSHGERGRSTKAGDYPRLRPLSTLLRLLRLLQALNEGRRLPPATTAAVVQIRAWMDGAQRRPEITPGYDSSVRLRPARRTTLNEGRRLPPATTRRAGRRKSPPTGRRSTKAGDYPRLRRAAQSA